MFVTQLRGNVMNMYLGTLAFDNVLAQISKKSYMRSWLLIPFVILGFIMVVSSFLQYFSTIATFAGVVFASWVGSTFGESMLVRPLYKIPKWSEFRRTSPKYQLDWLYFTHCSDIYRYPCNNGCVG